MKRIETGGGFSLCILEYHANSIPLESVGCWFRMIFITICLFSRQTWSFQQQPWGSGGSQSVSLRDSAVPARDSDSAAELGGREGLDGCGKRNWLVVWSSFYLPSLGVCIQRQTRTIWQHDFSAKYKPPAEDERIVWQQQDLGIANVGPLGAVRSDVNIWAKNYGDPHILRWFWWIGNMFQNSLVVLWIDLNLWFVFGFDTWGNHQGWGTSDYG